ncbi:MAG: glycosyltransferase [Verrucomicrobiota bacterium]
MNRCEIAGICLEKLAAQTLKPERVIVVNNASTDGTHAMLGDACRSRDGWIVGKNLETNLGNAGGMELAMEAAFSAGFQSVWILDDDSWPEPEALESLLKAELPDDALRSCLVVDLETGALSWPLQVPDQDGWRLVAEKDPLPTGEVIQVRRSWLGALIPKHVYDTVGPVNGRLFLRGEDEDYPRRIERAGFSVHVVTGSKLHHPPAGHLNQWEFAGRTVVLESGLSGDKLYYRLRNAWWMVRQDRGTIEAAVVAILHGFALWRWENSTSSWFPVWREAARDAFRDRLGKRDRPPARSEKN